MMTVQVFTLRQHPDFWWRWSWLWMRWEVHTYADYTFREGGFMYGIEPEHPQEKP